MSPRPLPPNQNEPLTPDERAWAERLRLVGPHAGPDGGPPPALDARILAAAQAAVARRPRRRAARLRWPTLVGAAASLVIVVGMAWQLQPLLRSRPSLGEGPVAAARLPRNEGALSPDVLAAADPVARRAVASPPSAEVRTVALPQRKLAPPPPAPASVAPAPAAPAQRPKVFADDAIPPYADYAGTADRQAASQAATDATSERTATGKRRAAAMAPQPFPTASAEADNQAALPAASSPPAPAPVSAPERRDFAPVSDTPMAAGAMTQAPESSAKAAAKHENPTLDRIEVTGSRIRLAELPVRDDAGLEPALWLQRIRDRRDADDLDGARASLALFRRHHPRVRVPDDVARLGR